MKKEEKGRGFVFPFEKLEVWQLAVDLADYILELLENFPPNKYLRLVGQMEAAVAGIPQNIAEGKGRQYKKEFIQFIYSNCQKYVPIQCQKMLDIAIKVCHE